MNICLVTIHNLDPFGMDVDKLKDASKVSRLFGQYVDKPFYWSGKDISTFEMQK